MGLLNLLAAFFLGKATNHSHQAAPSYRQTYHADRHRAYHEDIQCNCDHDNMQCDHDDYAYDDPADDCNCEYEEQEYGYDQGYDCDDCNYGYGCEDDGDGW